MLTPLNLRRTPRHLPQLPGALASAPSTPLSSQSLLSHSQGAPAGRSLDPHNLVVDMTPIASRTFPDRLSPFGPLGGPLAAAPLPPALLHAGEGAPSGGPSTMGARGRLHLGDTPARGGSDVITGEPGLAHRRSLEHHGDRELVHSFSASAVPSSVPTTAADVGGLQGRGREAAEGEEGQWAMGRAATLDGGVEVAGEVGGLRHLSRAAQFMSSLRERLNKMSNQVCACVCV